MFYYMSPEIGWWPVVAVMQQVVELETETKHAVVIDPMGWPDYSVVEVDLVDHLDSTPFVPCISLRDDWFVSYKSLAKKIKKKSLVKTSGDWFFSMLYITDYIQWAIKDSLPDDDYKVRGVW